jgi:Nif-specific regulatory protein
VQGLLRRATVPPYARALVLRLEAQLAISGGQLEEGIRAGAEALAALKLVPAPADYAGTAMALAQLVLERPDSHLAPLREWLEEAAAACERLGDYRGRERALQSLVDWYQRRGDLASGGRSRRALFEAVSELLTSLSDLRELAERAMGLVVEQLSAERGVFLVIDPESGRLTPLAEHGTMDASARRQAVGYSRRVVARVAESGGSLLVSDAPLDPRASSESVKNLRLRSILCTPLLVGERVLGAVYLDDSRRPKAFDESDQELLEGIAHLLAVAIDRSIGQQEIERTNELLIGENRSLRREVATRFRTQELIGSSLALQRILPLIERAAATNTTVLVIGESGTGKELIARIIHSNSKRRLRPFVAVNCGAITDTLVESELFGILPNVATGVRGREGLFRQADGGTLFLDEIGDMPLHQQVALFAAISNREISPVGGGRPIPIDVRIIAATNRDLRQMVEERTFREELYYRLHVFPIEVPPLRDRKADIPALARHFVTQLAALQEREVPQMSDEFMAALMRSRWPGNVREFQNYIERVMAVTPGRVLRPKPLPRDLDQRTPGKPHGTLTDQVEALERQLLQQALERCDGNQTRAARELGIAEPGVRYRMRKYGLLGDRQKRRIDSKRRMRT